MYICINNILRGDEFGWGNRTPKLGLGALSQAASLPPPRECFQMPTHPLPISPSWPLPLTQRKTAAVLFLEGNLKGCVRC